MCRRFTLVRDQHDGINQPGPAAEGVVFGCGKVALVWLQPPTNVVLCASLADVLMVQNQNGVTRLEWVDGREDDGQASAFVPPDLYRAQASLAAMLGDDHVLVSSDSPRATRIAYARRTASSLLHAANG